MRFLVSIIVLVLFGTCLVLGSDASKDTVQLIAEHGYPVQTHKVQTEDGYIMDVHHMPQRGPPVLLFHGVWQNSACWVSNGPSEDIAFMLYRAGFDVWLGNNRATVYGKHHIKYSTKDREFWEFSVPDMAEYDIPAIASLVLNNSAYDSMGFLCHSQGCGLILGFLADHPEWNDKFSSLALLAPAAFLHHTDSPLYIAFKDLHLVDIFEFFGEYTLDLGNPLIEDLVEKPACKIAPGFCEDMFFLMCGFNSGYINKTRMAVYAGHQDCTSTQNFRYGLQIIKSGIFGHYDYGTDELNIKHYGQLVPPQYDLKNIAVPITLYYGGADALVKQIDVEYGLVAHLDPTYLKHKQLLPDYNHGDFIYGTDSVNIFYPDVVNWFHDSVRTEKSVAVPLM